MTAMGYPATGQTPSGQLPSGAANLIHLDIGWSTLAGLAFPSAQRHSTLFRDPETDSLRPPYEALYDPTTGLVRTTLAPEHVNALVEFFLELGGHYIDPDNNDGSPSRKLARYQLYGEGGLLSRVPGTYPLTGGLARATVARRLLDTWDFLGNPSQQALPQFRDYFRARAYDHNGQVWPSTTPGDDADCVGGGLRAVFWNEDKNAAGWQIERGYQPKFLGLGGSYATMLTLFPPNQADPECYFWCTPGVEPMGNKPARFDKHMDAFANNVLMRSHFSDFENNSISSVEHYYFR